MIFFRFLKWWWGTIPTSTKVIVPLFLSTIVSTALLVFGVISIGTVVFLLVGSSVIVFLMYIFHQIYHYFNNEWKKYNEIQDREATEIMRKLSGKPCEPQYYNEIEKRKQAYRTLIKEFKQNTPIV